MHSFVSSTYSLEFFFQCLSHGSLLLIGKKMYAYLDLMNVGLFSHARKTIYFDVSL